MHDGFLFRIDKLCIPQSSIRLLLTKESHEGGLMGHFGVTKTLAVLQEHFYWPKMKRDMESVVAKCIVCHKAKSKTQPFGLLCLYLFLLHHGLIFLWILYLACLGLGEVMIAIRCC